MNSFRKLEQWRENKFCKFAQNENEIIENKILFYTGIYGCKFQRSS